MYPYQITNHLLRTIKAISVKISELNSGSYSKIILAELEQTALAVSSYSSTSIEGNPLPLTEVRKILKNRPKNLRISEQEVINYNDTLSLLNDKIKSDNFEFNLNLILSIHKNVTQKILPKYQVGKLRKEPVFVNDPRLKKTIYWPPDHDDIEHLLNELFNFIHNNKNEIDPLILAGIFHKQFVIIHPFTDGNGRTVRLATKVLLADLGINTFHLFSFENYYNKQVSKYFEKVGLKGNYYDLVSKIDFTSWLEYFSEGILDELLRLEKELKLDLLAPSKVLSHDQKKILRYLEEHGYIRDSDYAKITLRAKATRALDFKKLIEQDKIEKLGRGPATYYKLKKLS
jgi:Fic family protein